MGDKTLLERVIDLECLVRGFSTQMEKFANSVVLVAKKKPGPKRLNKKKIEANVRRKIKAEHVLDGFPGMRRRRKAKVCENSLP